MVVLNMVNKGDPVSQCEVLELRHKDNHVDLFLLQELAGEWTVTF